jgi:hypothetical protein
MKEPIRRFQIRIKSDGTTERIETEVWPVEEVEVYKDHSLRTNSRPNKYTGLYMCNVWRGDEYLQDCPGATVAEALDAAKAWIDAL